MVGGTCDFVASSVAPKQKVWNEAKRRPSVLLPICATPVSRPDGALVVLCGHGRKSAKRLLPSLVHVQCSQEVHHSIKELLGSFACNSLYNPWKFRCGMVKTMVEQECFRGCCQGCLLTTMTSSDRQQEHLMHWCAEWANGLKLLQELESAFNACVVTTG